MWRISLRASRSLRFGARLCRMAPVFVLAVLAASCGREAPYDTGCCYNSNFESAAGDFLDGWQRTSTNGRLGEDVVIESTSDAHSGRAALRMKSRGTADAAVDLARGHYMDVLKGRASFWYKAVSSRCRGRNLSFLITPTAADMVEGGGSRVSWTVPQKHVGDGRWHRAEISFDYLRNPGVEYTVVGLRVNGGEPAGEGEWLVDEIVVTRDDLARGPQLAIRGIAPSEGIITDPTRPVTVRCTVANLGPAAVDEAVLDIKAASVSGARRAEIGGGRLRVGRIEPNESRTVTWRCRAPARGWLALEGSAGGSYVEQETGRRKRAPEALGSSWTPVRTRLAATPGRIPGNSNGAQGCFSVGDSTRRIVLDRVQGPPILRYFVFDGRWREVARSPWLVRIGSEGGAAHTVVPELTSVRIEKGALKTVCRTPGGGGRPVGWRIAIDLAYDPAVGMFEVTCRARPTGRAGLRLLQFPVILVGEGTTGEQKSGAIFPGLDFLKGDERSSSTRDINRPQSERWSPHPYRLTLPVMAVATRAGAVGLAWDPLTAWYGKRRCPTPLFASPNFLDAQANHKLSLFVPSVPEFVPENGAEACRPAAVDGEITLSVSIMIEPRAKALDLVKLWVKRTAGLQALPRAPRSYQAELDLCAKAFGETIWNEQAAGWEPMKRQTKAEPNAGILLAALRTSREMRDAGQSSRLRAIADRVIKRHGRSLRDLDLSFACGGLMESLAALRREAEAAMREQRADGGWTFQPDKRRERLGKRGDTNIGICATKAIPVLGYAELTGDPKAVARSVKALTYMERFTVPAGAQVWECPLYAPDILAAARAVQAYMAGYRITGSRQYIEKASYWAWTGMPFIYLWSAPDRPVMKGATVPIFGATFFSRRWMGRPVQWSGLAYADAVLDLAPHDSTLDWRKAAELITRSAMRQQAEGGMNRGLFPDYWCLISNGPGPPWINPAAILDNLWRLQGKEWVRTYPLGRERRGPRITLSRGASFSAGGGEVRVRFSGPPLYGSDYVLFAGVRRPAAVTAGTGKALGQVGDLSAADSGWAYEPSRGWLVVKVSHSGGASVKISGLYGREEASQ